MSNNYQGAPPDAMSQLKQGLPLALLLSGVVLVLGVIGFFVYSWMTGVGDLGPIRPTATTETRDERVDDVSVLMESARVAMREDRMVQPAGENAVELYLRVLEREPENRAAREALTELIPIAIGPAERLVETGEFAEGERVLNLLQRADEGSVLVSALRQKLGLAQRAAEQTRLAEERTRQQRLDEASNRTTAAPATPPPAAPTLSAADINPLASNPSVAATRANQPATTPTAAATTTPTPVTPAPTVASAAPPPSAAPSAQDRNFELIRRVNPNYPARALRDRVQGWVEVEFTVTTNGDVENVSVVNGQPKRGEFDREAIRAVQQWKFRPKIENGRPVNATVKQRLNFTLGG
jgi:protein TonB